MGTCLTGVCGAIDLNLPLGVSWSRGDVSTDWLRDFPIPDGAVPRLQEHPHLAIVADVELHNREELISGLVEELRGSPVPDDYRLLLAAYSKWGLDCAGFLLGEFAFAIWDERRQRVYCCRDQLGFRSFFYWQTKSRFIFSSDINRLLACPFIPRELNRRKFAGFAVPSGQHYLQHETFHVGISSLPAGAWMTIQGEQIRQGRYWKPSAAKWVPRKPEEAYEALREVLFRAVECRLSNAGPVAAMLSGGLDSSAVVGIAARCLEKRNRELTAVAAVLPECSGPIADERSYIDEFRSWPNVRIAYVTAPGRGPFDSLNDVDRFSPSPAWSQTRYLNEELASAALQIGARTLLGGEGGELGPTAWSPRYYAELAICFRWATLVQELKSLEGLRHISPLRVLGSQFLDILFPSRRIEPCMLLTTDFRRKYPARPAFRNRSPLQRRYQAALVRHFLGKHAMSRPPLAGGLVYRSNPLMDKRVLELCLSLPADLNVQGGYQRLLIRKALDGILPKRIQWRTDKIPFAPDYFVRYNAQLKMAEDFVASVGTKSPIRSLVDVEQLEKLLRPVDPIKGTDAALIQVPTTIYAINFLRQFAEFRP